MNPAPHLWDLTCPVEIDTRLFGLADPSPKLPPAWRYHREIRIQVEAPTAADAVTIFKTGLESNCHAAERLNLAALRVRFVRPQP